MVAPTTFSENPYRVLGVPENADEKEIKKAYRKLALVHHPDRVSDPSQRDAATHRFASISQAYEILTDEHLRKEYHRYVADKNNYSSGSGGTSSSGGTGGTGTGTGTAWTPSPTELSTNVHKNSGTNNRANQSTNYDGLKPFQYQFSDPYEIWKRDFQDQFGFEYPGAKYDFVSYDTEIVKPDLSTAAANKAAIMEKHGIVDDGKFKPKEDFGTIHKDGKNVNPATKSPTTTGTKKGGGFNFNPFKKNTSSTTTNSNSNSSNETGIVVYDGQDGTNPKDPGNQLAVLNDDTKNNGSGGGGGGGSVDNTSALVVSQGRNNRPIAMDVVTKTEGKVTTTVTTITRPDGTTETMVMKTGIPKKKPPPALALTNGTNEQKMKHLQLTNGDNTDPTLQLTNGTEKKSQVTQSATTKAPPAASSSSSRSSVPMQLTNGETGKAPPTSTSTNTSIAKKSTNPMLSNSTGTSSTSASKNQQQLALPTSATGKPATGKKPFVNPMLKNK